MYFAGYLLEQGNIKKLTFLQKKAVSIMFNEKIRYVNDNKGFLVMEV